VRSRCFSRSLVRNSRTPPRSHETRVLDTELAARLEALIASETDRGIVLDLKEITLVDRAAVRFLAGVEAAGTEIVNCPEYMRTWIAAENDSQ
jgi:hypothetical protein